MKIVVGLGNYGKEYLNTRHNVGFTAIDILASKYNFEDFKIDKKFEAEIAKGIIEEKDVLLVKPHTYMNRSGESIQKILSYYKEDIVNLLVIHDDLDIEFGKFKFSFDRNSAGHKGVQSIINNLKSKEFKRIRIGIGKDTQIPTEKFVLEQFTGSDKEDLHVIIEEGIIPLIEKELN